MKKILKISSLALLLVSALACENDDQTIISATGGPELLTPTEGASYVLLPENAASEATTLVWNHADFDVQTAANYNVEVAAAGTDFATIIPGGPTITSRFLVWKVEELNSIARAAGIEPFAEGSLDIRIKSSVGTNESLVSYSNKITIKVTPYSTESPKLYLRGNFLNASGYGPDWGDNPNPPFISAEGFGSTSFEGYIYMNVASPEFKLIPNATNFDGDYGDADASGSSGVLSQDEQSNIKLTTGAGYYWVKANTDPEIMSYSATLTSWAVTGSATPNGWPDNGVMDHDMTYDATEKVWSVTLTLSAGELKFRANDAWAINYGDAGGDGVLDFNDGTNIQVTAPGTYVIKLNLSNPRNYTYTLTAQ